MVLVSHSCGSSRANFSFFLLSNPMVRSLFTFEVTPTTLKQFKYVLCHIKCKIYFGNLLFYDVTIFTTIILVKFAGSILFILYYYYLFFKSSYLQIPCSSRPLFSKTSIHLFTNCIPTSSKTQFSSVEFVVLFAGIVYV